MVEGMEEELEGEKEQNSKGKLRRDTLNPVDSQAIESSRDQSSEMCVLGAE